jgi:hypothetical protein
LCLAYSSTMKMEAICSSKTLSSFQTMWCYNPEIHTHYTHRRENLKSNKIKPKWKHWTMCRVLFLQKNNFPLKVLGGSMPTFSETADSNFVTLPSLWNISAYVCVH